MANKLESDKIGDKGEYMAALLLSEVAFVNPYKKDQGLDFYCEMRDRMEVSFYVQAKGSADPTIYAKSKPTISSLPVKRRTIEDYWLKKSKKSPVFVFMSDTKNNRTFYILVDENTYKPKPDEETYQFSIPLSSQITSDNIGQFVEVVIEKQPSISKEEREQYLEEHYLKNSELYHNLDEIERFLEVMRGSDQTAQIEAKLLLKQRFEEGMPITSRLAKGLRSSIERKSIPSRLTEGLKSIFINCKDSTTQHHVLDILLLSNDRALIPLILKQIERNMRLYEFKPYGYEQGRYTYTDFLFAALTKFKLNAKETKDLKRFLSVKDITINRGAIRACGELKINNAIPDIFHFLGHSDNGVQHDAVLALSKLDSSKVIPKLEKILESSKDKSQLAGAIRVLAELGDDKFIDEILSLMDDPSRDVRKAVALYLGTTTPVKYIKQLLHLMIDEDHQVRDEAARSVYRCVSTEQLDESGTPVSSFQRPTIFAEDLEELALPLLIEEYEKGRVLQVARLLPLCKGTQSLPTLLDIYSKEEASTEIVEFQSPEGKDEGFGFFNLKTSVLDILIQHSVPDIEIDIVKRLESTDVNPRYIDAAGKMKLETAFDPLTKLIWNRPEDANQIAYSLVSIDGEKAQKWSIEILKNKPPLNISLACFEILYKTRAKDTYSDLIKTQVLHLMSDPKVRRDSSIYSWVGRCNAKETIPLIVSDLEAEFDTLRIVRYRMLEIVMGLDAPKGRDVMITILPKVDDGWKYIIIGSLGKIGDSTSIEVITEYQNYPNYEISKLVEEILSKVSNG